MTRVPIVGIGKGFGETIKSFFRKPVTVEYPEEYRDVPENYRGRIKVYMDLCVGCTTCSLVCPNATCQMEAVDYHHPKNKRAIFPRIDVISCMYCGLCEESCPTDAIRLEKEFPTSHVERESFDYDTWEISKDQGQVDLERRQTERRGLS